MFYEVMEVLTSPIALTIYIHIFITLYALNLIISILYVNYSISVKVEKEISERVEIMSHRLLDEKGRKLSLGRVEKDKIE